MVQVSYNGIYKQQQSKLVRATFKKGIISSVNVASATANVQIVGNQSTILKNIPFSSQIIASLVLVGDKCKLDLFDEANPNDMVISYIYGRAMPLPTKTLFANGVATILASGTNPITVTHNLGVIPDIYGVNPNSQLYYSGSGITYTLVISSVTATSFQVSMAPANPITVSFEWFVVKFG